VDATRKDMKASFMVVSRCLVLVNAGEEEVLVDEEIVEIEAMT